MRLSWISKFPLESYQALRLAANERENRRRNVFRASVIRHIRDIADKYIIPGETAESALMFLPAESVYAELHARFVDVVEFFVSDPGMDRFAHHFDGNAQYGAGGAEKMRGCRNRPELFSAKSAF